MSNQPLSNASDRQTRIESKIDTTKTQELSIGSGGAMKFSNANDVMEFAKIMSLAGVAIPKHLRANPGACLAVSIQASEWMMSPFAVANKSYSVNDRLAYEAQLVNAVILRRAPIKSRFRVSYSGEGDSRRCTVSVVTNDGETVSYESPKFGTINPKNSPLWKTDPDQQLYYYSSRAMCRRHFPDVLLGVYTLDEMQDSPIQERQATGRVVTESPAAMGAENPYAKPRAIREPFDDLPETRDHETTVDEGFVDLPDSDPCPEHVDEPADEEPQPEPEQDPVDDEKAERLELVNAIKQTLVENDSNLRAFAPKCRALGILGEGVQLPDAPISRLREIAENRLAIHLGEYQPE